MAVMIYLRAGMEELYKQKLYELLEQRKEEGRGIQANEGKEKVQETTILKNE